MGTKNTTQQRHPVAGYLVGIGFFITAAAFALQPRTVDVPLIEKPAVQSGQIVLGQFRQPLTDPPMINIGTLNQRCNDCHALFQNEREPGRALTQHTHIKLDHGTNDACLNCHDKEHRNKLFIRNSEPVGYDHVEQLCAQCHGLVYRDWQAGTHGKTVGYWNTELGEQTKLNCTQCHDPHAPAFDQIEPLPGPNTLRMGDQHVDHEIIDPHNPLTRWRLLEQQDSHRSNSEGDH